MPELPEVETIANDLVEAGLVGSRIEKARVFWQRSVAVPTVNRFIRRLAGATIVGIHRRGKFIVFDLEPNGNLLIHLRMSGRMVVSSPQEPRNKHQHVILRFKGGQELRFQDPRKFGRLYLVDHAGEILNRLGPEPLEQTFLWQDLKKILVTRKRMLKPLLLDQQMIAGLGNIYVDEALWEAAIHPLAPSHCLTDSQIKNLHAAIRKVLKRGLRNRGTALGQGVGNFSPVGVEKGANQRDLKVFRRQNFPCPRCRKPIVRLIVGQRATHICPVCQITPPA